MLKLQYSNAIKKEIKKQQKRGKDLRKLTFIISKLALGDKLDDRYRNHKLTGNFKDHWECHIEPDWLLIYRKTKDTIIFERTGSHSDLFE